MLCFYLVAVDEERDFILVGINLDGDAVLRAIHIALGTDMYKGIFTPVCLIEVEAVLFRFTVKCDEAFMIHPRFTALITGVSCKIKHIPDVGCPHPGVALKAFEHVLMINRLIFFRVVAAMGMGGMQVRHTLTAVFGISEATVRINFMEEIHPQIVQEKPRNIPSKIQVPAYGVCDVGNRIEGSAHGIACQSGESGGIHLMAEIVQFPVVVQHVFLVLGGDGDLVAHTPADNGCMVVVLHDQLFHLADGVCTAVRHVLGNVRNLRPDHHAPLIAEVIEVLIVLVVCKPDGVCTDFTDQVHILQMFFFGDGIAEAFPVLMAGNTA